MNGILAIDKPRGLTSHDVVARIRRLSGQRRVGHAGTLDPMATGVLLLCLGEATRLSDWLMDSVKWYLARVAFGVATDTDDAEGTVIQEFEVPPDLSLEAALRLQVGSLDQLPPQYAAIKRGGVPAYELARRGQVVDLAVRSVQIFTVALLATGHRTLHLRTAEGMRHLTLPTADLLVACSKGTYIRALARDLGHASGCGATLAGLRRLASGSFTTRQCVSLADLEQRVSAEGQAALQSCLRPLDLALAREAVAAVGGARGARLRNGVAVELDALDALLRVYDARGGLLALVRRVEDEGLLAGGAALYRPARVFSEALL